MKNLLDINKNQIKPTIQAMKSIKVTKGKLKQIAVIKWFINVVNRKKTPIINIRNTRNGNNNNSRKKITVNN